MKRSIRKYYRFRTGIRKVGIRKPGEKKEGMKYVWPSVLLCFLAGIIVANMINQDPAGGYGIWNMDFIEKFKYGSIRSSDLFYYVLEERFPVFLLLTLFTVSNWGILAGTVYLSWQSFAAGFLMAHAVITYGFKGILLMGTAVFPQYLLYLPVYVSYLYLASFLKEQRRDSGETGKNTRFKRYLLLFLLCLLSFLIYITGIFLESYINPFLLKKILKIF